MSDTITPAVTLQKAGAVMGILNVTPDSFYDGGQWLNHDAAIAHAHEMVTQGADIIDIGGASSRPHATPVAADEEQRRVLPVIEALAGKARVSIDTTDETVARRAVKAGATLINDVSGTLYPLAGELGVGWVAMHRRGDAATMDTLCDYDDVVKEVHAQLLDLGNRARQAGVEEIYLDPGIGFAKTEEQSLLLLSSLGELVTLAHSGGFKVLLGASRKRALSRFGASPTTLLGPGTRLEASLAVAVWAFECGVDVVRVHDVAHSVLGARLVGGLR
jgi:dihydropteroate synthase